MADKYYEDKVNRLKKAGVTGLGLSETNRFLRYQPQPTGGTITSAPRTPAEQPTNAVIPGGETPAVLPPAPNKYLEFYKRMIDPEVNKEKRDRLIKFEGQKTHDTGKLAAARRIEAEEQAPIIEAKRLAQEEKAKQDAIDIKVAGPKVGADSRERIAAAELEYKRDKQASDIAQAEKEAGVAFDRKMQENEKLGKVVGTDEQQKLRNDSKADAYDKMAEQSRLDGDVARELANLRAANDARKQTVVSKTEDVIDTYTGKKTGTKQTETTTGTELAPAEDANTNGIPDTDARSEDALKWIRERNAVAKSLSIADQEELRLTTEKLQVKYPKIKI